MEQYFEAKSSLFELDQAPRGGRCGRGRRRGGPACAARSGSRPSPVRADDAKDVRTCPRSDDHVPLVRGLEVSAGDDRPGERDQCPPGRRGQYRALGIEPSVVAAGLSAACPVPRPHSSSVAPGGDLVSPAVSWWTMPTPRPPWRSWPSGRPVAPGRTALGARCQGGGGVRPRRCPGPGEAPADAGGGGEPTRARRWWSSPRTTRSHEDPQRIIEQMPGRAEPGEGPTPRWCPGGGGARPLGAGHRARPSGPARAR